MRVEFPRNEKKTTRSALYVNCCHYRNVFKSLIHARSLFLFCRRRCRCLLDVEKKLGRHLAWVKSVGCEAFFSLNCGLDLARDDNDFMDCVIEWNAMIL
jgi:hypothetical protein